MKVDLVVCEDWAGLYVDGQLKYEDHHIRDWMWLEVLKSQGHETSSGAAAFDADWFDENGSLPNDFKDVEFAAS